MEKINTLLMKRINTPLMKKINIPLMKKINIPLMKKTIYPLTKKTIYPVILLALLLLVSCKSKKNMVASLPRPVLHTDSIYPDTTNAIAGLFAPDHSILKALAVSKNKKQHTKKKETDTDAYESDRMLRGTQITSSSVDVSSVYTGVEKTLKRAISLNDLKRIKGLDLSLKPNLDFARDMFLFCFYTRGMSFIDMAYLRKKDLQNGILSYRRRKTGQQLFIKWERCMQEIVDKYPINETEYLLPIITKRNKDYRKQYTNELHRVNHLLKKIGKQLDLSIPLTMYVGRHSWASIAKSRNVPISVISEGMGHDSENTTQIYLASLDTSVVDRANKKILDLL